MLHELEHTVQFAGASYGQAGKLCEYAAKGIGTLSYNQIDMERAADRKADSLIDTAYWVMNNGLPEGVATNSQVAANEIIIFNDTEIDVVLEMATAYTENGPETVPAYSWMIFTGAPKDTWFNVGVGTTDPTGRVHWREYGYDSRTRLHIDWSVDESGYYRILDLFYEQ
jgi:hypothetical protein